MNSLISLFIVTNPFNHVEVDYLVNYGKLVDLAEYFG
jgi:hypothetical protein